jgi:hypothetical protein
MRMYVNRKELREIWELGRKEGKSGGAQEERARKFTTQHNTECIKCQTVFNGYSV